MTHGFLLVDKPPFFTSFNMVSLSRKVFQQHQVGHSGTLDPFATGLLIVAVGEARKLLEYLPSEPKEYTGTAVVGATSSTYDIEGDIIRIFPLSDATIEVNKNIDLELSTNSDQEKSIKSVHGLNKKFDLNYIKNKKVEQIKNTNCDLSLIKKVDLAMINKIIQEKFIGRVVQVPPAHSAIRVNGVHAYHRARKGEEFEVPSRTVTIYDFEVLSYSYPHLTFRASVSSGTYIRSLLHDLGREIGLGAYIESLRRTQIANFSIAEAVTVPEIESYFTEPDTSGLAARLVPLERAVTHLPRREVTETELDRLSHGLFISALDADLQAREDFSSRGEECVLAAFLDSRLVGVLEFSKTNELKFRKKICTESTHP